MAPMICGHMFGLGSSLSLFHSSNSTSRLGEELTPGVQPSQQPTAVNA
uniref:Uncharacterized protein n=1 Tax=Caenorhabditis japonica TaxID=281687 RepID=A0A8R1I193_CAEJA